MKRAGFTMIELIFVIVILGILAAVAIPKLSATRDDAMVSKEVSNLGTCVTDLGANYTADGNITDVNGTSSACGQLVCFSIATTSDGNVTVSNSSSSLAYCTTARTVASNQDLNGTHAFGQSSVVR